MLGRLSNGAVLAPRTRTRLCAGKLGIGRTAFSQSRRSIVRHAENKNGATQVKEVEQTKTPSGPPSGGPKDQKEKVDAVLAALKEAGMTPAKAQQVLKMWAEMGANDPETLRKLLLKRSLQPLKFIGIQTLLDTAASAGGFWSGNSFGQGPPFFGQIFAQGIGYFIGCYYLIQVVLELTIVGAVLYTAYKYSFNSVELLSAVQQLAGPKSDLTLVNKAQTAVNTVKVMQILDSIVDILKEQYPGEEKSGNTLQNLSAYLTLANARDKYGFDSSKYDLSAKQASDIAYVFSVYDVNDDGRLELSELRKLSQGLGKDLNEDELKEAMKILDTSKNGTIEFDEFVSWWVKGKQMPPQAPAA